MFSFDLQCFSGERESYTKKQEITIRFVASARRRLIDFII